FSPCDESSLRRNCCISLHRNPYDAILEKPALVYEGRERDPNTPSLNVFIKISVIWKRVHDYQLGFESYQLKVNLTAPKVIFPSIKEKKPYAITSLPFVGLIYENNKKKKRIMDIDEISEFCDSMLKKGFESS
nr:hypothetical protein [Tanacetum cinerariifolium]